MLAVCVVSMNTPAGAATTVAAGSDHTLAVTVDGAVWAWGDNSRGQLGIGIPSPWSAPVQVPGLERIAAVAAGDFFSVALEINGSVWTWGANDAGQLGDGTMIDRSTPAPISGLPGVIAVSAAADHVAALTEDGTVWTWGRDRLYPERVEGLPPVRRIDAARGAAYATGADGTVWTWTTDDPTLRTIQDISQISDLAIGFDGTLITVISGRLVAVAPSRDERRSEVENLEIPAPVRSVALVGDLAVAVADDGSVWTVIGALSEGRTTATAPTTVTELADIVAVTADRDRALALERGGALWSWSRGNGAIERVTIPDVLWQADAPNLHPPEGSYSWPRYVTVVTDTPNAEIHVTDDGRAPTLGDPFVGRDDAVLVTDDAELRARAWADDLDPSRVATARYTIGRTRRGSDRQFAEERTGPRVQDSKNGADLIYQNGFETGDLAGWSSFQPPPTTAIGAPVLTPEGGVFAASQNVTVTCPVPGAVVRYTTSGAIPTEGDPIVPCGGTIAVNGSTTVRARAWAVGFLPSAVAAATFHLNLGNADVPSFDPPGGAYGGPQSVSISTTTPGATIRYTLDGAVPGFDSPIAAGPVAVSATAKLTARAFLQDFVPSASASATYVIGDPGTTGAPLLSPGSGTYPTGFELTVSNTTPGATIRYTTDGTVPDETDDVIADGGAFTVTRSLRIIARAWADGLEPSPLTIGDYDIVGAVAAGVHHSIALRADGTMVGWGYNTSGEVGDGTTIQADTPVDLLTLTDVVAIDAGSVYSMALTSDGTVWTWGWNHSFRLGVGSSVSSSTVPIPVQTESGDLTGIATIAAGYAHAVVIASDHTLWGWGGNLSGQLGLGHTTTQQVAVPVPNLGGVSKVAAGAAHTLVLKTDGEATGSLWVFGSNSSGQLGDGTTTNRHEPTKVLDGVRDICAGGDFSFALMADGTVLATGFNDYGNLGLGHSDGPVLTWTPVDFGSFEIGELEASGVHSVALTSDRTLLAFGNNTVGQLGNRTTVSSSRPTPVVFLPDVVTVDASPFVKTQFVVMDGHTLAITADGRVWAWGRGARGKLGIGYPGTDIYRPVPVSGLSLVDRSWPDGDADSDGLTNERELELGTDPFSRDSNSDGIDDLTAVRSGLDPLDPDMDDDGVDNATEREGGTNPLAADSDGDGVNDGADCFPLDPDRATCPEPTPGDTEPPVITLIEPTNAVLISTTP